MLSNSLVDFDAFDFYNVSNDSPIIDFFGISLAIKSKKALGGKTSIFWSPWSLIMQRGGSKVYLFNFCQIKRTLSKIANQSIILSAPSTIVAKYTDSL